MTEVEKWGIIRCLDMVGDGTDFVRKEKLVYGDELTPEELNAMHAGVCSGLVAAKDIVDNYPDVNFTKVILSAMQGAIATHVGDVLYDDDVVFERICAEGIDADEVFVIPERAGE